MAVVARLGHFALVVVALIRPVAFVSREVLFLFAIGIGVGLHFAILPHTLTVYVHLCASAVAVLKKFINLTAKSKQLRAGRSVPFCCDLIAARDVKDVLIVSHVAVVDVQRSLIKRAADVVYRTVFEVDRDIVLSCTVISVNIDHLAGRIEGAAVKGHHRGGVRPERIIATGSIEGRVLELGTGIAPVEGLAVDDTVLYDRLVCTDKAKIVLGAGAEGHVLEGDRARTVKAVVTVVLGAKVCRVRDLCTDVPRRFVGALTNEGQVLALGRSGGRSAVRSGAVNVVQGIVSLAQLDGSIASGGFYRFHYGVVYGFADLCLSLFQRLILCRKCHHRKHLKHHGNSQKCRKKPVMLLLFHCYPFLSSHCF